MVRLLMEDAEWTFFEPFIVAIGGRGGRPAADIALCLMRCFGLPVLVRRGEIYRKSLANGPVFTANSAVGRFPACGK